MCQTSCLEFDLFQLINMIFASPISLVVLISYCKKGAISTINIVKIVGKDAK